MGISGRLLTAALAEGPVRGGGVGAWKKLILSKKIEVKAAEIKWMVDAPSLYVWIHPSNQKTK